jgi:hypothetical protein
MIDAADLKQLTISQLNNAIYEHICEMDPDAASVEEYEMLFKLVDELRSRPLTVAIGSRGQNPLHS